MSVKFIDPFRFYAPFKCALFRVNGKFKQRAQSFANFKRMSEETCAVGCWSACGHDRCLVSVLICWGSSWESFCVVCADLIVSTNKVIPTCNPTQPLICTIQKSFLCSHVCLCRCAEVVVQRRNPFV